MWYYHLSSSHWGRRSEGSWGHCARKAGSNDGNPAATPGQTWKAGVMRSPAAGSSVKRHLCLSHDHANVAKNSWMMEVVQVVYNPQIYLTDEEVMAKTRKNLNVQSFVEKSHIMRLIAMVNSIKLAMLCTTGDRTGNLGQLKQSILFGEATLTNEIIFFTGDLQSRLYELGVKRRGGFKCGAGCGIPTSAIPLYLEQVIRNISSLADMQARATAGKFRAASGVTNLQMLPIRQLREEITKRGLTTSQQTKEVMQAALLNELQGQQRVPALLSNNSTLPLKELHIQWYQIPPLEPRHDLKGVIFHVMQEMQRQLPGEDAAPLKDITQVVNTEHNRGCDWRKAAILAARQFTGKPGKAFRKLTDISAICYAQEKEQTPKMLLHLGLCIWQLINLMHELSSIAALSYQSISYTAAIYMTWHTAWTNWCLSASAALIQNHWCALKASPKPSHWQHPAGARRMLPGIWSCAWMRSRLLHLTHSRSSKMKSVILQLSYHLHMGR